MSSQEGVSLFLRLTTPHHERLFSFALSLSHDPDRAADLTQDALIKAFKAFHQFREGQPVLPWLTRILRNVYLDTFKTGRAKHELAEHQFAMESKDIYGKISSPDPNPLAQLERSRLGEMLLEEMNKLIPTQRQVLILCELQGFSYEEIAEMTETPIGTVRSRIARGRQHLRQYVQERMAADRKNQSHALDGGTGALNES